MVILISGRKLPPSSILDGIVSCELAKTNFYLCREFNGVKYIPCLNCQIYRKFIMIFNMQFLDNDS